MLSKFQLTSFQLKMIAIIGMLCDHIGKYLLMGQGVVSTLLLILGNLAFPIFAFLIAEGYERTKNVKKYMLRLFYFGLISQIPFYLLLFYTLDFSAIFQVTNVFFTLLAGLIAIYGYQSCKNKYLGFAIVIAMMLLTLLILSDYGPIGVLSIFFFHFLRHQLIPMLISQSIIFLLHIPLQLLTDYTQVLTLDNLISLSSILPLLLIGFYRGQQGKKAKYLFYLFYPAHFLVLFILKITLGFPLHPTFLIQ